MDNKYNDNDQTNHYENDGQQDPPEYESNESDESNESSRRADPENTGITQNARQNAQNSQPNKPKQRKSSNNLLSGILGGIVSAVIIAVLFATNIIPTGGNNQAASTSTNSSQASESAKVAKTITSDGAATAKNMDEAADAVVGVTRKQQTSVWEPSKKSGTGSGIIYKKEDGNAYVVTNNHVVEGAQEVDITLNNEEQLDAKVLGADNLSDLAVLKVDGSKIDTVANLGSSDDMKVGDTVVAIGNPLGMEFANTLTKGIVSGLNRSVSMDTSGNGQPDWVTQVIQTDAAINPGNSGGALVNKDGKVIGINSMKIAKTTVEGIGFAIPIDSAKPMIEQLEKEGSISRPFIGVSTASINQVPPRYRDKIQVPKKAKDGMVVAKVDSGSPADSAGLKQFDVITKINGNKIKNLLDLRKYLYNKADVGDTAKLQIYRNGEAQKVSLKLAEREQTQQQAQQQQQQQQQPQKRRQLP
ncbi:serine protease HtrC [Barrientosiimonas marina]|uniref:S1C family serine protease n=1 Tax=Lentibacillus kimchii TaxID=1542911 RepID=A0ABW2USI5_9BACI